VFTRVADGRARVVREIGAAGPLMDALRAPVPSRGPWLTAALNSRPWSALPVASGLGLGPGPGPGGRPIAVVVEPHRQGRPAAVAFLVLRRRGLTTCVTLLGQDAVPVPDGRPPLRLLARDDDSGGRLAAAVRELLGSLRGAWTLRLAGLPLGDPTVRALASELPTAVVANERSNRLVDELQELATPPIRSRDPRVIERWLPAVLDRERDERARRFLRATARLHAAIGQLELSVVADGEQMHAALLTLVDGDDRWPWWGVSDIGGLRIEMGSPLVTLTARGGLRLTAPPVDPRLPTRSPRPPWRRSAPRPPAGTTTS
jgi:hypothetical protein